MNVQEFTLRTGYTPATEEEWKAIETMYMEAGEKVDKDLFCKEWLEHKDSKLLKVFYKRATDHSESNEYFRELCTESAYMLLDKAEYDDDEMYYQAIKLIGQKRVVIYKLNRGLSLRSEDLEYINDNLQ